jgi:predicted PurR-regulated permease PerM
VLEEFVSDTPPPVAMVDRRPDRPAFYWLATVALMVAILARAQTILIPVALSVVVAFALGPLVKTLERRLGRPVAVAVVAVVALAAVAAFGYLLERQLVDLSAQMTKYSDSIGNRCWR